ncbi:hypothetical protein [uncultured Clostridium sp.]|uniref:hypothetical protein n=1 Tax=uncultured Clostridium sp. TaxID=59620 RepID=UPI0026252C61|nr:hypothetical protein [uncultured Clostridium sp.]
MKSRFILPNSVVTKLSDFEFDFFKNIFLSSPLISGDNDYASTFHKSVEVFSVDDSFSIFSLTYDMDILAKGIYKVFLYPGLKIPNTKIPSHVLNTNYRSYTISEEDIEVILNSDQTFNINIKLLNKAI